MENMANIQALWNWFEENATRLHDPDAITEAVLDELREKLAAIHPGLVYEFSGEHGRANEFIISADGEKELFPTVIEVVKAAPTLPDWKVSAFRQPGSIDAVIEINGSRLGPEDIWFEATIDGEHMDLSLFVAGVTPSNRDDLAGALMILLDNALGEYAAVTAVRSVNVKPLPANRTGLRPFIKLPQAVCRVIQ